MCVALPGLFTAKWPSFTFIVRVFFELNERREPVHREVGQDWGIRKLTCLKCAFPSVAEANISEAFLNIC